MYVHKIKVERLSEFNIVINLIIEYHCILSRISPSKNARESVDRPPVYSSIMHCLCKKCFNC